MHVFFELHFFSESNDNQITVRFSSYKKFFFFPGDGGDKRGMGVYGKEVGKQAEKYQTLPLHLHLAIKSKGKIDETSRVVPGHAGSGWQVKGSWG